ncbi:SRPBCC family protein [Chelativorans salis]|uniref:SRPBCC family protein n=1 Tax=Chelativorans salis TaxID=2978478 RepID=A0ABT2LXU9_9HYPH|nr:SRPBCC family protein [Chelativorans sp. EGI FJ00035]MCT7378418.1 SRPBCC family protein [Chelativorans sp. EGI FJ00035]
MTAHSVAHTTFTIERHLTAQPERVFAAWSNPEAKRRWSSCHEEGFEVEYHLDFRVGGTEVNRASGPDGPAFAYEARLLDIVPNQRIIYAFNMHIGEKRVTVSLATVLFEPAPAGTKMTFTEQIALLDGYDDIEGRKRGTEEGMDRLQPFLDGKL